MRQIHLTADDCRPPRPIAGRGAGRRQAGQRPADRHRHHVPGQHVGALAHGGRKCCSSARIARAKPSAHAGRIREMLRSVRLEEFAGRHPHELSGGMQQRAAFCQALVHEPDTLLLDEPLGKLDAMTREGIRADLQTLWMKRKPTVVFVTHSIEEAVQLSSTVCVITPRPGRIECAIDIDLPWPRDLDVKSTPEFTGHVHRIQGIFRDYGVI
ncbi:ABC transporter ATP-binding protein [Mesorhizobium sp. ORM6]